MNSTIGKSLAILFPNLTTNEAQDKVATQNPPESIDAEVTEATEVDAIEKEAEKEKEKEPVAVPIEATRVDAIAHKLPANEEDPTEKETEKEAEKGKEKEPATAAPETVRLTVLTPSQPNEMSPPPSRKLRSSSRISNRDPSPASKKKVRRLSPRTYSRRRKVSSPPFELNIEDDVSSSGETSALTTQSNRGSTTSSVNNRAI